MRLYPAIIGLAALAPFPVSAQRDDASKAPSITVIGVGEIETPPEIATIAFDVRGEGATADAATKALVKRQKAIFDGLASLGSGKIDINSDDVKLAAVRSSACKTDDDGDARPILSTGACAVSGYVASLSVRVRMTAVKDAGTAVGLAARLGANDPSLSGFELRSARVAHDRATVAAIADARSQAEAIAKAAGETLGPLLSVHDQQTGYDGEDIVVTGLARRVPAPPEFAPIAIDIAPKSIETTARLIVSYAIVR